MGKNDNTKVDKEEILSKEGDVFGTEEIADFCYIEKINREEFDLHEKYCKGVEFKDERIEIIGARRENMREMLHKKIAE